MFTFLLPHHVLYFWCFFNSSNFNCNSSFVWISLDSFYSGCFGLPASEYPYFSSGWKFSVLISSNTFAGTFPTCSFHRTYNENVFHLMLSQEVSLKDFNFFFSFCCCVRVIFSLVCLPVQWFILLLHPVSCWICLVYFSVRSKTSRLSYIFYLCWKCCHVFSFFIRYYLYDHYINCFISSHFIVFFWSFCSFIQNIFLCLPVLPDSLFVSVWDEAAVSASLEGAVTGRLGRAVVCLCRALAPRSVCVSVSKGPEMLGIQWDSLCDMHTPSRISTLWGLQ